MLSIFCIAEYQHTYKESIIEKNIKEKNRGRL